MLPDGLRADLERYVELLQARFGPDLVSVIVFGSHARGEARPESDVDLLIVAHSLPRSPFDRNAPFRDAAREVSEEAQRVKPYYLGMLSGHVLLFDRDGFFRAVLERLQRRLAELGSRRYVDEDGYEYWDLKPDWKPGDVVEL
jgi:hypothetical protein